MERDGGHYVEHQERPHGIGYAQSHGSRCATATIIHRRLDENHDPQRGQGKANFLIDADAVAQAVLTRLLLFQGEWWESTLEGLPLWQEILGQPGGQMGLARITLLLQQRILGTPYVQAITALESSFDSSNRTINFYAEVKTRFGMIAISNIPDVMTTRSLT